MGPALVYGAAHELAFRRVVRALASFSFTAARPAQAAAHAREQSLGVPLEKQNVLVENPLPEKQSVLGETSTSKSKSSLTVTT